MFLNTFDKTPFDPPRFNSDEVWRCICTARTDLFPAMRVNRETVDLSNMVNDIFDELKTGLCSIDNELNRMYKKMK